MLLWFRNDVRIHDNPALHYFLENISEESKGKAVFFLSKKQWRIHQWSAMKIDLLLRHVDALKLKLSHLNIELDIIEVDDFDGQVNFIIDYCRTNNISQVVANSELEINEQTRDNAIAGSGIELTLFESDVIVPKGKVLNQSGQMFKVFTPFKKAWLSYIKQYGFEYLGKPEISDNETKVVLKTDSLSSRWPLSELVEQQVIPAFMNNKLDNYSEHRDFPGIKGTSGLSPYLAIGAISPRYVLTILLYQKPDLLSEIDTPAFSWLNELIWRDFYRHLMFDQPRLCKHQNFKEKYNDTVWPNNQENFELWCNGRTGYPIVDAAMRQLNQTGWMHNRLRMIVASFLTKHLLVDWRWGEKYFMQQLIDGDLAANNGGWQWAASTGCDAQPYFRVFNPIRQSERFDPNGEFIRSYIPELENIPDKHIHFPHQYIDKQKLNVYWPAIVEHKQARDMALIFYK